MVENLGEYLLNQRAKYYARKEEIRLQKISEDERENQRLHVFCNLWLEDKKSQIETDIKTRPWDDQDEKHDGFRYVLPSPLNLLVHSRPNGRSGPYGWYDKLYLHDLTLWENFRTWGREHGLKILLDAKTHLERDYYFLFVTADIIDNK